MPDTITKKLKVVLPGKQQDVGLENLVEVDHRSNEIPSFDGSKLPKILDSDITPYLRDGHKEVVPTAKGGRKRQVRKK